MKKAISLLLVLALLVSPVFADVEINANQQINTNVNDNVQVTQNTDASVKVTPFAIKWREFRDDVKDLTYDVRYRFTFDEEARVDLIHERNAELKARQEAWVQYKNAMLQSNATVDAEAKAAIKAKHEEIIKEHVELTQKLNEIKAEARSEGNVHLESKVESELETYHKHVIRFGLGSDIGLIIRDNPEYMNMTIMTEAQIRARVEAMGLEVESVELIQESGIDVWHVHAKKVIKTGPITITSRAEMKFDARTGYVLSVEGYQEVEGNMSQLDVRVRSDQSGQVQGDELNERLKDTMKRVRDISHSVEVQSRTSVDMTTSSTSGSSNVNSSTNTSANASGNSASASASVSIGAGV